jgi:hypothetical protein
MNRDTADRISYQFTLACMQARPNLQAESADGLTHRSRASNRPGCPRLPMESGEHAVAGSDYFSSSACAKFSAERCVIVTQDLVPATVAEARGFFGRADDIDKQNRGKHAAGLDATLHRTPPDRYPFQQLFVSMAAAPRNCSFHVVLRPFLRTTAECFLPWSSRPVNSSGMARSTYLDRAPLQQHSRADPTNRPGFGRVPAHIRMMNADAEEFRHWRAL